MNINYLANFVVKGHHPSVDAVNVVVTSLLAAHMQENGCLVANKYIKELEELRDEAIIASIQHWSNSAGEITDNAAKIISNLKHSLNSHIGVLKTLNSKVGEV